MTEGPKTSEQYVDVILAAIALPNPEDRAALHQQFLDCFDFEQLRTMALGASAAAQRIAQAISTLTQHGELERRSSGAWYGAHDATENGPAVADETVQTLLGLGEVFPTARRLLDQTICGVRRRTPRG